MLLNQICESVYSPIPFIKKNNLDILIILYIYLYDHAGVQPFHYLPVVLLQTKQHYPLCKEALLLCPQLGSHCSV